MTIITMKLSFAMVAMIAAVVLRLSGWGDKPHWGSLECDGEDDSKEVH